MIICIMALSGDQSKDVDEGSEEWTNPVDRGGLWHLSDEAFTLFFIIEEEIQQHLTISKASKQQEGSRSELIDAVMMSEDLKFQ